MEDGSHEKNDKRDWFNLAIISECDFDPPCPPLKSYALVTSFVTILKALFHKAFKKENSQPS
jgi:hypothetical protein